LVKPISIEIPIFRVILRVYIIIFFLLPFSFFCQEKKGAFNLLLTAGVVPAQVHGDAYSGFHKLGAMGGIGIERFFNEKVRMNLSIIFIQKGAKKNQNLEKNDLTAYYLNLNYLEVPLLLNYTYKKVMLDIGVSAAYLINYYEGTEFGNQTGLHPFQKFDYSVKIGLGYNINENWFVNLRSSNSFITTRPNYIKQSIYYNNIISQTFNKGYYNNILEFTLGYRIRPHKKSAAKT
jgi:hypothetical protein